MKRVFLMILDSFGIGSSDDAEKFNDVGSNTLGNIAKACFLGKANIQRQGNLYLPNLMTLGLAESFKQSTGQLPLGIKNAQNIIASYGYASEISCGKDTTSGHWEIAGVPVLSDWLYFEKKNNSFPLKILEEIQIRLQLPGFLGNCHASGTDILINYGKQHIKTGKPIIYTSSDSVFQVACHEVSFGLSRLYHLCDVIRGFLNQHNYNVARVIARPFIGDIPSSFQRTGNRRDLSIKPFKKTVMEKLIDEKKGRVVGIGKISDIYAGVGISKSVKANGLLELCNTTINEMKLAQNNTIVCTNFVDFDSLWGHRRDISGYAKGLEFFDSRLPDILDNVKKDDLLIITADHGCDPSWTGTDHTREYIPILLYSPNIQSRSLGHRKTFCDIAQTIARYFRLSDMKYGTNML